LFFESRMVTIRTNPLEMINRIPSGPKGVTGIVREYLEHQFRAEHEYGQNTVVLIQVGDFYETYQIENPRMGRADELAILLNFMCPKKNGDKPFGHNNPRMAGFNLKAFEKNIAVLLRNNYTVVLVDQELKNGKLNDTGRENRHVARVCSPGTFIESDISGSGTNYLMAINIEIMKESGRIYAHLAAVDLATGHCCVHDVIDESRNSGEAINDIRRYIGSFSPAEIIINENHGLSHEHIHGLGIQKIMHHYRTIDPEWQLPAYQESFLQKVYGKPQIGSAIEASGLVKFQDLIVTFIWIMQFAYQHDPTICSKIRKPDNQMNQHTLMLNDDSILQLNIVPKSKSTEYLSQKISKTRLGGSRSKNYNSVLEILDKSKTEMGSREIKRRLIYPLIDHNKIQRRLDNIEAVECEFDDGKYAYTHFRNFLDNICDVERLHRRIISGRSTPNNLYELMTAYPHIHKILRYAQSTDYVQNDGTSVSGSLIKWFKKFMRTIETTFDYESLAGMTKSSSIDKNIFRKGVFPDIDAINKTIIKNEKFLDSVVDEIEDRLKFKINKCYTDATGYYFTTTSLRSSRIVDAFSGKYSVAKIGKSYRIESREITKSSNEIMICRKELINVVSLAYHKRLGDIYSSDPIVNDNLLCIIDIVVDIDIACSSIIVANKFGYCRPSLIEDPDNDNDNKYTDNDFIQISARALRHPIIEQIIDTEYTPNNIKYSKNSAGMLLYGLNSAGKSSLLRALGCAIVMAQAGFYVAAKRFRFIPYNILISKISKKDDLFSGQSLFAAEMQELAGMLSHGRPKTMILVDELCSSSEHVSATSLVAAAIKSFAKSGATYMMSTHFHELVNINSVQELSQSLSLQIKHFKVHIKDGKLTYDRTLQNGPGETLYGIEIAQCLGLTSDFIAEAFSVRMEIEKQNNMILTTKRSKYNKNVYVHECEICGKQEPECGYLETHHKKFQCTATKDGIIENRETYGAFHKDAKHNLMILCKKCHIELHKNHEK